MKKEMKKGYEAPKYIVWEINTDDLEVLTASEDNGFKITQYDGLDGFPE